MLWCLGGATSPEEECMNNDEMQERTQIIADTSSLKKHTMDYSHPEYNVSMTDFTHTK